MADMQIGVNDAERARNRIMGLEVVDPHPRFDELRAESPVQDAGMFELFGLTNPVDAAWPGAAHFSLLGYEVCDHALKNHEVFSSKLYEATMLQTIGRMLLLMDEPDHSRYRALAQPAFAKRAMQSWEHRWVAPMLDRLIDSFVDDGRADLSADYAARFPVFTISSAFGVDPEDVEEFHSWAHAVLPGGSSLEGMIDASDKIAGYLARVIEQRRAEPSDDLISLLIEGDYEQDGQRHRLSDDEIVAFARIMIPAGAGTTYRALGNLLVGLLTHPETLARLREDTSLLPAVVEEGLRWDGPLAYITRMTTRDYELEGTAIPAGSVVEIGLSAANHDPERFDRPHEFDPFRRQRAHLSFASGVHHCIGIQLARRELVLAVERLLERLPGDLRLDPEAEEPKVRGLWNRMPPGVPVVFG